VCHHIYIVVFYYYYYYYYYYHHHHHHHHPGQRWIIDSNFLGRGWGKGEFVICKCLAFCTLPQNDLTSGLRFTALCEVQSSYVSDEHTPLLSKWPVLQAAFD
jgi:hypothetical protein